jgi:hypothetical protein
MARPVCISARLSAAIAHFHRYATSHMRAVLAFMLAVALVGCAHTPTTCKCSPLPARSLESFGSFDSSTTLEDVVARVGEADYGVSISGLESRFYHLADHSFLVIEAAGPSQIYSVKHGDAVLYDRYSKR